MLLLYHILARFHSGLTIYNANVDLMTPIDVKATRGEITDDRLRNNQVSSRPSGTFTFNVEKGTYYIRLRNDWIWSMDYQMTPTFRASSNNNTNSNNNSNSNTNTSNAPIMTVTLPKGGNLQLGAALPASNTETPRWRTNNRSVATVNNSGYVRAIDKGTARIRVTAGDTTLQIRVIVT